MVLTVVSVNVGMRELDRSWVYMSIVLGVDVDKWTLWFRMRLWSSAWLMQSSVNVSRGIL